MNRNIVSIIKLPDRVFVKFYLRFFHEKNSLLIYNFHILFRNEKEINSNHVNPLLGITVDHFQEFIEYYLDHDYIFVSQNDIIKGLNNDKKYILITFDDGYFNSQYALPILKKYHTPAVFFISANNVKYNKSFWWDVLYREIIKGTMSFKDISRVSTYLMLQTSGKRDEYIKRNFGEDAFNPISDIDRPFTPKELKDFCKDKYVFLGNHTSNHDILTNYSSDEIKLIILDAQNTIHDMTGVTPISISYPNGNFSNEIIKISKEIGFKLGITTDYKKNYLPIICKKNTNCMQLGRFDILENDDIIKQCELYRSDLLLFARIWNLFKRKY